MLTREKLETTLPLLTTLPAVGIAFRAIHAKHASTALSSIGSFKNGGRYNIAQEFEVLYLSDNQLTALLEVEALVQTAAGLVGLKDQPRTLLCIEYRLNAMLDLTDPSIQSALSTNFQELTGHWISINANKQIAPTQQLGAAVHRLRNVDGLKYPSARNEIPNSYNLAIFPDRLLGNCYLEVYDNSTTIKVRIP